MLCLFSLGTFIAIWAMLGYPVSLRILDKLFKPKANAKNYNYEPNVTLMIVAHNEEKVIEAKLNNAINLDYPKEKLQILVTSDNSDDNTNIIVENFIAKNKDYDITLHKTLEHKGKTNAQNEGQKLATGEILIMTDANSILDNMALKELVASFTAENISYVAGRLAYVENLKSDTNKSENTYWNLDLYMRDVESRFDSITAGNGALYACRNDDYILVDSIDCHDGAMPFLYALKGKRSIYNPDAIAYEKTGATNEDEFKRKVRMSRNILANFKNAWFIFKTPNLGWFRYFYFGHRNCRNWLWLAHLLTLFSSFSAFIQGKRWGKIFAIIQILFYGIGAIALKFNISNRFLRMIGYYIMTVLAQLIGAKNSLFGKSKPIWEKVENTR